jgi:hypothetical protein
MKGEVLKESRFPWWHLLNKFVKGTRRWGWILRNNWDCPTEKPVCVVKNSRDWATALREFIGVSIRVLKITTLVFGM